LRDLVRTSRRREPQKPIVIRTNHGGAEVHSQQRCRSRALGRLPVSHTKCKPGEIGQSTKPEPTLQKGHKRLHTQCGSLCSPCQHGMGTTPDRRSGCNARDHPPIACWSEEAGHRLRTPTVIPLQYSLQPHKTWVVSHDCTEQN